EAVLTPPGKDLGFLRLAIVGREYEEVAAARKECAFRYGHGGARPALDGDAGEGAGPQFAVLIGKRRLDLDGAAVDVDRRVDGINLAFEARAGQRVGDDLDLLANSELRQIELGHAEIDLQTVNLLKIGQRRTGSDVSTGRHGAEAHDAREGSLDRQLLMLGFDEIIDCLRD